MKPKTDAYRAALYTWASLYIRMKGLPANQKVAELAQLNRTRRLLSGSGRTFQSRKESQ